MNIVYTKKRTKNLGNYENLVVEITGSDEVNFELETADQCFNRLSDFVNEKVDRELGEKVHRDKLEEYIKRLILEEGNKKTIKAYFKEANAKKMSELSIDQINKLITRIVTKEQGGQIE